MHKCVHTVTYSKIQCTVSGYGALGQKVECGALDTFGYVVVGEEPLALWKWQPWKLLELKWLQ